MLERKNDRNIQDLAKYKFCHEEHAWILGYDKNFNFIKSIELNKGTFYSVTFNPDLCFQKTRENNFYYIIMVHNHPDDPFVKPSIEDRNVTLVVLRHLQKMHVRLYDHLIFGAPDEVYSFRYDLRDKFLNFCNIEE